MPQDVRPPTTKQSSVLPTSTDLMTPTIDEVMTEYRPDITVKTQDKNRVSKFKQALKDAKRVGGKIVHGIETAAKVGGMIAEYTEPFIDAAAVMNPALAPFAIADTALAETNKLIELTTSERGRDSFKQLTDTSKYQKMTGGMTVPRISMMDIPEEID